MKSIQKPNLKKGTQVFFVNNGTPHTGKISEVYDNTCLVEDVTFLDSWEKVLAYYVPIEHIYKTAKFYLPQYPTQEQQSYLASITNQCYTDTSCTDLDFSKVDKFFPKKTLFKSTVFPKFFDSEFKGYIKLKEYMLLLLKDYPGKVYTVFVTKLSDNIDYPVLEEFSSMADWSSGIPTRILIPYWKEPSRNPGVPIDYLTNAVTEALTVFYSNIEPNIKDRIEYAGFINEYFISQIWSMTDDTFTNQYVVETPTGLTIVTDALDQIY